MSEFNLTLTEAEQTIQKVEETLSKVSCTSGIILRHLMTDIDYARRYLAKMDKKYFASDITGGDVLFEELAKYVTKYDSIPTLEQLVTNLDGVHGVNADVAAELAATLQSVAGETHDAKWMADTTDTFITEKYNDTTVLEMLEHVNAKRLGKKTKTTMADYAQKLLTPPLLDSEVAGMDSNAPDFFSKLYDYHHQSHTLIPFDLEWLNRTIRGVKRQHLNIILAPTNVGKSLFMCHLSAMYLRQGLNVLYVSMEMDTMTCVCRIHANLFDTPMDTLETMTEAEYERAAAKLQNVGRLVVRDYPTGTAHAGHFRAYLAELKVKANFVPDVIFVDYLNICSSERMQSNGSTPQYQVIGSIVKELRTLAQQMDAVVWTATQANRDGLKGKLDLSHTSDSLQTAYDADLVVSLWKVEQPDTLGMSILKHRNGSGADKHGVVGVAYSRMKVFDIDQAALEEVQKKLTVFRRKEEGIQEARS